MNTYYIVGILIVLLLLACVSKRRRENLCLCNQAQLPGTEQIVAREQRRHRIQKCDYPEHLVGVV